MFIPALFTTARKLNQPRYSSTDKQIIKTGYIYTMKFYSAERKIKF